MSSATSRAIAETLVSLLEMHHDNPPMQWDIHFLSDTRADFRLITSGTGTGEPMSLAIISAEWAAGKWVTIPYHQCASPALVGVFGDLSIAASLEHGVQ